MKIGRGRTHYWDTCVFLHWLSDPVKDKNVIDAIEDIVRASERGDATIFTSTITCIEVLRGHLSVDAAEKFVALFPRAVEWVNVTPTIAQIAHDIRDYYHSRLPQKKLKTPDCIHLATAIANSADEMNTLDKPDMLSLNENVLGGKYKLKIIRPVLILPPLLQPPPALAEPLAAPAVTPPGSPSDATAAIEPEIPQPKVDEGTLPVTPPPAPSGATQPALQAPPQPPTPGSKA